MLLEAADATRKALQASQYSAERPLTQLNYSYFQEQCVSGTISAAANATTSSDTAETLTETPPSLLLLYH